LSSRATEFTAPCASCREELGIGLGVWLRAAVITGTLCAEADVGFTSCPRGHRVVVRRAVSRRLAAVG
jgi:hypothetical protein